MSRRPGFPAHLSMSLNRPGRTAKAHRTAAGMTPEELGARVYLTGSQIRKVEDGTRTPTEALAEACEA
jgi:hypothetical protein